MSGNPHLIPLVKPELLVSERMFNAERKEKKDEPEVVHCLGSGVMSVVSLFCISKKGKFVTYGLQRTFALSSMYLLLKVTGCHDYVDFILAKLASEPVVLIQ